MRITISVSRKSVSGSLYVVGALLVTLFPGLLFLGLHSPVWAQEPLSREQQAQVYDHAVHILGGNANVLSRWVGELRYKIYGSDEFILGAETALAEVADLTNLKLAAAQAEPAQLGTYTTSISKAGSSQLSTCSDSEAPQCANYLLVQASNEQMRELAAAIPLRGVYQKALDQGQRIDCFFAPFQNSGREIHQALVYINVELGAAMQKTCLHEEIYQSLGLFNDWSGSEFFSFNNVVAPKEITRFDKALLKTVYANDFAPGTPVFRVIKRFLESLGFDPFGWGSSD